MPQLLPDRISCAGLVKIELEGKLLATINRNRLKKGEAVYSPPGGSYHYVGRSTRQYLKEQLGLVSEHHPDLRFPLEGTPSEKIAIMDQFSLWFASKQGRETNPSRELYEELVCDDPVLCRDRHIFPRLTLVAGTSLFRSREKSTRQGQEDKVTAYFLEIFDAHLTRHSRTHLQRTLRRNYPYVHLLSLEEIAEGRTRETLPLLGEKRYVTIASTFKYLT